MVQAGLQGQIRVGHLLGSYGRHVRVPYVVISQLDSRLTHFLTGVSIPTDLRRGIPRRQALQARQSSSRVRRSWARSASSVAPMKAVIAWYGEVGAGAHPPQTAPVRNRGRSRVWSSLPKS